MPKISEEQRTARKQAFLDAALECLRTKSYARLTVDEICARAGASKGAFYLYFHSKQDLLFSLLDEQAARFKSVIAGLEREDLPAADRLERFVQAQLREVQDPAQLQLRIDVWGMATTDAAVRRRLRIAIVDRRASLRRWIQQSVAAGELMLEPALANALSSALLAFSDGLTLHRGIDPSGFRWENVSALVMSLFTDRDREAG